MMELSLKAREDQAIEVSNQNLNYQDFKFKVSKCCLVWTYILSHQIFRIYWSRIRPCSQERICSPRLVLQVCKTARIIEIRKYLFQWSKQSKSTQFQTVQISSSFCLTISTIVNSISSSILRYGVCLSPRP
jgi:Ni,Fe-hydrogenase I cytochrome b subunit